MKSVDLLLRKKLSEDIQELYEINFNDQRLINSALDAEIMCGFEAEVVWPSDNDGVEDQVEQLGWFDIRPHVPWRVESQIESAHYDWIRQQGEYTDAVDEKLQDEIKSSYSLYMEDWFYLKYEDSDLKEDEEISEFIERKDLETEYTDWLTERVELDELDRISDEVISELTSGSFDMDEYIRDEWATVMDFLGYFGLDASDVGITVDDDEEMQNIGEVLERELGVSVDIERTYGDITIDENTPGWVVGPDTSIEASEYEIGAEIKSNVYTSPRYMLDALESLYRVLHKYNARTNSSTGLHVTMSWWGSQDQPTNRLKMAILLGDEYVLGQFNRLSNTYARSQYDELYRAISKGNIPTSTDFNELEKDLSQYVSKDKFRTIHYRGVKNEDNNELIEFRAAGGKYLDAFEKVSKIITRYAIVMQAGHDPDFERESYAKALMRLFKKASDSIDATVDQDKPAKSLVVAGTPATYQGQSFTMGEDGKWKTADGKSVRPKSRLDNILHNLSQSGSKLTKIKAINIPLKPLSALMPVAANRDNYRNALLRIKNSLDIINALVQRYPELKSQLSESDDVSDEIKSRIKDEMSRLIDNAYFVFTNLLVSMVAESQSINIDASTVRSLRSLYKIANLTPEDLIRNYEGTTGPIDWIVKEKIKVALSKLIGIKIPLENVVEIHLDTPSEPNTKIILETLHYISLLQDNKRKESFINLIHEVFPDVVNILEIATFRDIQDMARTIKGLLPTIIKAEDFAQIKKVHANLKRTGDFLKFDD